MHTRLRELRVSRGYGTQKEFCRHAERYGYRISLRRYGEIERGTAVPTIYEIRDICKAMKISADAWLFGRGARVDTRGLSEERIEVVAKLAELLLDMP